MSTELEAFRVAYRAAGQPYSLWGGRTVGIGLLVLVAVQVILIIGRVVTIGAMALTGLSLAIVAAGWVMLMIAFVRRRRWAKAQDLHAPPMSPPS